MNLFFNTNLAEEYHSNSQKIRVMSENWVNDNVYCVRCGNKLSHFENNKPVGDFYCEKCKEEFELKSNKSKLGKKIVDGAYETMIDKIRNGDVPNFFYLNYKLLLINQLLQWVGYTYNILNKILKANISKNHPLLLLLPVLLKNLYRLAYHL